MIDLKDPPTLASAAASTPLNGQAAAPSNDYIVQIEDVHKSFVMGKEAVPALRGVSLNVKRGEILCLMGPSGSGKTTMLNIIGGLDTPSRGHVLVDGDNVVALNEEKLAALRLRKMGFVFQNFNLLPRTSALEQVIMPLSYTASGMSDRQARDRGKELLRKVGLGERMDHTPSQLSGGQQQRVAIARALVNRPPVLFADEPTGNLDSKTTQEVLKMFQDLNRDEGITIILVTHDPVVAASAKRNIRLKDGLVESDFIVESPTLPQEAHA